ncbi:MAG: hypothetical protein ACK46X_00215 [Candidatus Sericytochromatia bacterium]
MLKRMLMLGMVVAIGGGLAGCVVEDEDPAPGGGGGTTVIDRERVIERDSNPPAPADTNIHVNPPADTESDTKIKTEHRTTTTTD